MTKPIFTCIIVDIRLRVIGRKGTRIEARANKLQERINGIDTAHISSDLAQFSFLFIFLFLQKGFKIAHFLAGLHVRIRGGGGGPSGHGSYIYVYLYICYGIVFFSVSPCMTIL